MSVSQFFTKPNYNRIVTSSFVEKDVKIIRNDYAIPNIIGQSNEDTFYALGYVHAQDRLWQMELLRRVAKGRLSEVFGEDMVKTDKFFLSLGIDDHTKETISHLDDHPPTFQNQFFYHFLQNHRQAQ